MATNRPANPAPVSGPGALSQRTDGGPSQPVTDIPGLPYGEQAQMNAIQGAARMFQEPAPPEPPGLFDPTMRPDEPVTAGVNIGPGPGAPIQQDPQSQDAALLQKYLPSMRRAAGIQDAPAGFKAFVRYLESFNAQS